MGNTQVNLLDSSECLNEIGKKELTKQDEAFEMMEVLNTLARDLDSIFGDDGFKVRDSL